MLAIVLKNLPIQTEKHMARYDEKDRKQDRLIIVSHDKQLEPGTLEHAIDHVVENVLDLSIFDKRYKNDETGRKAIHPKNLLRGNTKVNIQWLLYCVVHNIEKICTQYNNFVWHYC